MTLFRELGTQRLHLRALRHADEGPITRFAGDQRIADYTDIPHPYPPGAAKGYIASALSRQGQLVWALDATLSGGADFVGVIGFRPEKQSLGYWIGPPFWRQGFATEAATMLTDYLLTQGLDVIHATAMTDNEPSQKVLERAGFTRSGTEMRFSVARDAEVDLIAFQKHAA